ncbi:MAG: hypothetical protein CO098_18080 [Bacteroidetes bacterium CG_4_9_14_3_um_filter_41_19]|nr:MAG: hypothetical protein CO098_18080 [Bacteroidetes bacterium CG_4_9_14_3_um_filter_41_19]
MGKGYQDRDYEIIDYQLYQIRGFDRFFRGPKLSSLNAGKYFMCLGAAQTFGCFTETPFPFLLKQKLSIDVINAGAAGAGPILFLKNKRYIQLANQSRFVIIQLMSGRSESNQYFDNPGGRDTLVRRVDGKRYQSEAAYNELLVSADLGEVGEIIEETKKNYMEHMLELLHLIEVPKILFWFSERPPEYIPEFDNAQSLFGKYPQLIDQQMLNQLIPYSDYFVLCSSRVGLPQKLINRFTGEKTSYMNPQVDKKEKHFNYYYPSPEMHQLAFDALYPVCQKILSTTLL